MDSGQQMKLKPKQAKLEKHFTHHNASNEIIDEDYLNWIRQLTCCVEGCNNNAVPHHLYSRKLGRNDHETINICQFHHVTGGINDAIHQMGKVSWSKKFGINLEAHAKKLHEQYTQN